MKLLIGIILGLVLAQVVLHWDVIPNSFQNWVCYHVVGASRDGYTGELNDSTH